MISQLSDNTYKQIKTYSLSRMAKLKDSNHNDEHVIRVKNNALKIIRLLGIEKEVDENLLKAICLLHDFTYTIRKPSLYTYIFEGHIERRIIRLVLEKFDLSQRVREIIVGAVFRHTHSFPFRRLNKKHGIYSKILQDADTLDFFNCLRIKMFMSKHDKGIFRNIREYLSGKLIEYGINNLGKFLNYPKLARSFFLGSSMKCL
ncbi:MAG TPA: HD domain-containing protein [Patescibacteria group bacterium]|nr:HD domain-containing protein [Patescibacteria group bacterium]